MAIRIFEMSALRPGAPLRPSPWNAQQTGAVGAQSEASSAFNEWTSLVTIQSDEACHVAFGTAPEATTAGFKIAAGETHDFAVSGGHKVAWIAA